MNSPNKLNKRAIGGTRVISRCDFLFPRVDMFNSFQTTKSGVLVFNVRGGFFVCKTLIDETEISRVFPVEVPTKVPEIQLAPAGSEAITLADYSARFLKFDRVGEYTGMVFRFVNLVEAQLDELNSLTDNLPNLEENEEHNILEVMKGVES